MGSQTRVEEEKVVWCMRDNYCLEEEMDVMEATPSFRSCWFKNVVRIVDFKYSTIWFWRSGFPLSACPVVVHYREPYVHDEIINTTFFNFQPAHQPLIPYEINILLSLVHFHFPCLLWMTRDYCTTRKCLITWSLQLNSPHLTFPPPVPSYLPTTPLPPTTTDLCHLM